MTLGEALTASGRLGLEYYQVDGRIALTHLPQPDEQTRKILEGLGLRLPSFKPPTPKNPAKESPRPRRRSQTRSARESPITQTCLMT
ncbi:MAG: hypothetical protein Kow00109_18870 [Acidobacteriota bacterium]